MKILIDINTFQTIMFLEKGDSDNQFAVDCRDGLNRWTDSQYSNFVKGKNEDIIPFCDNKYKKLLSNEDGTFSIAEMTIEEKAIVDAANLKIEKYNTYNWLLKDKAIRVTIPMPLLEFGAPLFAIGSRMALEKKQPYFFPFHIGKPDNTGTMYVNEIADNHLSSMQFYIDSGEIEIEVFEEL